MSTVVRYRDSTQKKQSDRAAGWRTVGGGASVFIDDSGKITAGCPGLVDEDVDNLIDESDASRDRRDHRQDVAEAKGIEGDDLAPGEAKQLEERPHPETGKNADGEPASSKEPAIPRWSDTPWQPPTEPLSDAAAAALDRLRIRHGGVTPAEALASLAAEVSPGTAVPGSVPDTAGDRNSAAEPHLQKIPDASLAHAMRSLHGTRDNRRNGKVESQEFAPELAAKMHAAIQAAIGQSDGFGEAHDLGKLGLGYASPAGSLIVKKPAKKGAPWTVSYTAQTEMAGVSPATAAPGRAATRPKPAKAAAPAKLKTYDVDFDPSSFGPATKPKKQPPSADRSPFASAIESAAAEHELDPADLTDAANFVWQERRKFLTDQEDAMRELIGHFDKNRGAFTRALQRANDPDEVPYFDEILEAALNSGYAELFGGNRGGRMGLEARLFDFLKQGKRRPPARHDPDIIAEAISLAKSAANVYVSPGSDDFARTGQVVRYCRWRAARCHCE